MINKNSEHLRLLEGLYIQNAESDALQAAKNKDYRLLAMMNYTFEVPGVEGDFEQIKKKYALKILEGTSDSIENSEYKKLIDNAYLYAKKYNQKMVKIIEINKLGNNML